MTNMSEDENEEVSINEDKPIRKESLMVTENVDTSTLEDMSQKSFSKDESDEIPNTERQFRDMFTDHDEEVHNDCVNSEDPKCNWCEECEEYFPLKDHTHLNCRKCNTEKNFNTRVPIYV